ncbi:30S ribosomal protein THX [Thermophagus xiamenensis]|uniref:Ribosomal small subunit protein bTHX n=1 Tax=Thermophagus xiamenensis TaxID=385682 RepID=A0A1I2BSB3_9BACT|nr:ribosomal small subunit protein bTHX [Thermophagus xiamenensis]
MGKGDRKTRRGKLFAKTYGNSRPRNKKKANAKNEKENG